MFIIKIFKRVQDKGVCLMKKGMIVGLVLVVFAAQSMAAFVAPTTEQIAAAASDPAAVKALMKDANATQAAGVIEAVLAKIVTLKIPEVQINAAIASVISNAFSASPNTVQLSAALGKAVGANAALAVVVPVISQAIVATVGGNPAQQTDLGKAFNSQLPPVSSGYNGQNK